MDTIMTPTAAPVNYIKEFFSKEDKGYDSFFTYSGDDTKVTELIDKIKDLQTQIDTAQEDVQKEYAKKYAKKYTPYEKKVFLKYVSRMGTKYFFSVPDGQQVDPEMLPENTYTIISVDCKAGEVATPVGYCYETASIITKNYNYSISTDNTKCKLKLTEEISLSFLEENEDYSSVKGKLNNFRWEKDRILNHVDSEFFLNTLFGTSRKINEKYTMSAAFYDYMNNKSFENIFKTAPDEILMELLDMNLKENKPVHQILGLDKDIYNEGVKKGLIKDLSRISWAIKDPDFNKTGEEWIDMINKCKKYEKDLDFYNIHYTDTWNYVGGIRVDTDNLISLMSYLYKTSKGIMENYSFGKFVNYVVKETVDQAYSNIRSYVGTLSDYIEMCITNKVRPSLYTSNLSLTHAIAQRNHKINVSIEDENIFIDKYKSFKPFEYEEYTIIAPTCTDDVKKEGDQLDHCVASYIKRVIDGECLIYFLRNKGTLDKSQITIEIEGDSIVQARGLHNKFPDAEESKILDKFAEDRKLHCCYAEISANDRELREKEKGEEK